MFIIRTAFWLSLVILLLPAEEPQGGVTGVAHKGEGLTATTVIGAAHTTINDISGICSRSPDVCEVGSAAFDVFVRKAKYGANRVLEMLSEDEPAGDLQMPAPPVERQATNGDAGGRPEPASQHTLTPADMEPAWQAPLPDQKA